MARLAALYKRRGQYERAVELWRSAADGGQIASCVELAKYHEHQRREYEEARALVVRAIELAQDIGDLAQRQSLMAELDHRLRRLCRKARPRDAAAC